MKLFPQGRDGVALHGGMHCEAVGVGGEGRDGTAGRAAAARDRGTAHVHGHQAVREQRGVPEVRPGAAGRVPETQHPRHRAQVKTAFSWEINVPSKTKTLHQTIIRVLIHVSYHLCALKFFS